MCDAFLKVIRSARVRVNARKGCSLNAAVLVRAASRIASEPRKVPSTAASTLTHRCVSRIPRGPSSTAGRARKGQDATQGEEKVRRARGTAARAAPFTNLHDSARRRARATFPITLPEVPRIMQPARAQRAFGSGSERTYPRPGDWPLERYPSRRPTPAPLLQGRARRSRPG
jgi:hypothetical protein